MPPLRLLVLFSFALPLLAEPIISGELKTWHQVTLAFTGPETSEADDTNPFISYRFNVTFEHPASNTQYLIPGHFAADGKAAHTSAARGSVWRVHFAPDRPGTWKWTAQFRTGNYAAVSALASPGQSAGFMDGATGSFAIAPTDKTGRDFRAHGRLVHDGSHYPRFLGSGQRFLKQGPDSPENFLSYADFDGTFHDDGHKDELVKTWEAHLRDWRAGDPTWENGRGKAIIGALNYLAAKNLNAVSMLTMNVRGDDQNVWPFTDYDTHDRYDISKLDQWEIVLNHAQRLGICLEFKLTEVESQGVLDGGGLGLKTKLYFREMISRFGHLLAIQWNLGEESGEWVSQHPSPPLDSHNRRAQAAWWQANNPYDHLVVIHNGVPFNDLLGPGFLDGVSVQVGPYASNAYMQHWRELSRAAGHPWIVAHDEHGPANSALPPDAIDPDHLPSRQGALWGALLGGAWGNQWYFGYQHPHSDLTCQDWRSRELFWDMASHALAFFQDHKVPFWDMLPSNDLVNGPHTYVLAQSTEIYVIYLRSATGQPTLNLAHDPGLSAGSGEDQDPGTYSVHWYNPRTGGALQSGSVTTIKNLGEPQHTATGASPPSRHALGAPPVDPALDWIVLVRRVTATPQGS